MSLPKQKYRELLFQILFSLDFHEKKDPAFADTISKEFKITKKTAFNLIDQAFLIVAKLSDIDALITEASTSYDFERISKTELNILRLALYEMLYEEDIPIKVSIAEAIRLTRKFGTRDSANFINAILDDIYKSQNLSKEPETEK
jgi:transcription antitermination protein NusB